LTLSSRQRRQLSLVIAAVAIVLALAPIPGLRRPLRVATGSELEEPMRQLEARFERANPDIDLIVEVQGAQDMVNRSQDGGDSGPQRRSRVLIPANGALLTELAERRRALGLPLPFHSEPQPVARTLLVAVVWAERSQVLFGSGPFSWPRLRRAVEAGNWRALGGPPAWGSFDLRITDPARSNSGQLTLALWTRDRLGPTALTQPAAQIGAIERALVPLRRAVYQPPRSTDILLREFIAAGPNDGDVAMVYESAALARWAEALQRQGQPYRILYPNPTFETVLTAVVMDGSAEGSAADGERLVAFLRQGEQQLQLRRWGYRPAQGPLPQAALAGTPWGLVRSGVLSDPGAGRMPPPSAPIQAELLRGWQRAEAGSG
jgi:hypothetical protein